MEEENKYNLKGVTVMNGRTREEHKQYKREVIEYTRSLIEKGVTGYEAKKRALMEKYSVTDRMAKKYIKYTKEDIEGKRFESQQQRRDNMLIIYEGLLKAALAVGDRKEAREVMNAIEKLEGMQAPKAHTIKHETTTKLDYSHLSIEQLQHITNLLDKPNSTIDITHEEV
jgi:hypothetical protein